MRKVLIALALIASLIVGYRGYNWKRHTDKRSFYADAAGAYLFGPSGVVNAQGERLTRQQILDAYLHAQIQAHPEWNLKFEK